MFSRRTTPSPSITTASSSTFSISNLTNNNATSTSDLPASAISNIVPQIPPTPRRVPPKIGLLRHLSGFLESKKDLMNDWEIGGTQNKWVCPSDRHLHLRAQLKSGWSVRTATARSPTNSKAQTGSITAAEQEHIQKVLAKAEESKSKEQQRIGKMVDRLEKMRRRATGNGVTHCLLCHTEFGLLASKSYAAMCVDCRKYVCQRNCGVETTDVNQTTGKVETVFLCKICSEAREVLWKKSGAWFYKEMPEFQRPDDRLPYYVPVTTNGTLPNASSAATPLSGTPGGAGPQPMTMPSTSSCQMTTPKWASPGVCNSPGLQMNGGPTSPLPNGTRRNTGHGGIEFPSSSRPSICSVLQAIEPLDRSKSPRPRIQPRWVNEKVMSSMSVDDEEKAASSSDGESFVQSGVPRRALNNKTPVGSTSATTSPAPPPTSTTPTSRREANMERFSRHTHAHANRLYSTDDDDDSSPESRPSTRSTSPRHSLATPSSYAHDTCHDTSLPDADTRSIDSGVVQSDHSNPQQSGLTCSSSSLTPLQQQASHDHHSGGGTPRRISNPDRTTSRVAQSASGTSLVTPPPPISSRTSPDNCNSSPLNVMEHKSSSASTASSGGNRRVGSAEPVLNNHHAMHNNQNHNDINKKLISQTSRAESPLAASSSFLSSPDDDTKQKNRRRDGVGRVNSLQLRTSLDDVAPPVAPISKMNGHIVSSEPTSSTTSNQNHTSVPIPTVPVVPEEEEEKAITASTESASEPGSLGSITLTLTYHSADKKLKMHLIRAKNLKAMDSNGFSDPYVKFHLLPGNTKATKLTSKTIEKTLNPEWNEEMSYYGITEDDKEKKILRVTVLDRDRIGSDFLGETRIALKKLNDNEMKKFNLYLESALPVPQQTKEEENEDRGKINVGLQYNIQQGSLFININRCVELVGMDSTGFSDPYCKVSLTPITSKAHRAKTSTKKRTLNPEWNEQLQFVVPFKDLPKKTLQIGVYDHDLGKHDDYIGGILLSTSAKDERGRQWIKCIENPGTLVEAWHRLELDS
ncbi:Rabphilin-1 [Caenorhabditis elegans]|uniref:Isoform b of Rabphilin-1 n=1 Tax=Caenorhabditis elegans TaxID=6239 RepID=P41885-3|nr:Rabphilin-1 [Caenorhabditis elegans]CCD70706.1 Rabphilin-1 [Caenorhabditis elegans]|eukprot:NP_001022566.1 Rabphilin-1 [Caenorhabditis elegans]